MGPRAAVPRGVASLTPVRERLALDGTDSRGVRVKGRIVVTTEKRLGAEDAIERLGQVATEWPNRPSFLVIDGWPALQRRQLAARQLPGPVAAATGRSTDESYVLRITTAIAAGGALVRIEGTLEPDAEDELAAEVEAIGRAVSFTTKGDPEAARAVIERISTAAAPRSLLSPGPPPTVSQVPELPRGAKRFAVGPTRCPGTCPGGRLGDLRRGEYERAARGRRDEQRLLGLQQRRRHVRPASHRAGGNPDGRLQRRPLARAGPERQLLLRPDRLPLERPELHGDLEIDRQRPELHVPRQRRRVPEPEHAPEPGRVLRGPGAHRRRSLERRGGGDQIYSTWRNFDVTDQDPAIVCSQDNGDHLDGPDHRRQQSLSAHRRGERRLRLRRLASGEQRDGAQRQLVRQRPRGTGWLSAADHGDQRGDLPGSRPRPLHWPQHARELHPRRRRHETRTTSTRPLPPTPATTSTRTCRSSTSLRRGDLATLGAGERRGGTLAASCPGCGRRR